MDGTVSHTFRRMPDGRGVFYGWFEAMHSRFDLLLAGIEEAEGAALCTDIARETRRIEGRLSRFDERSEVGRFNGNTYYDRCHTDSEMLDIFEDALRYRELTCGAFDICIQTPGYDPAEPYWSVDRACDAILMPRSEVVFDFGGYGKGYALEKARDAVTGAGIGSALLSFGNSSVCGIGLHPTGVAWQVGIANPLRTGSVLTHVVLRDVSLSSSGNTPRSRGHILSPLTGERITDDRIVSVVGVSPLDCEVLSTALLAATGEMRGKILRNFALQRAFALNFSSSGSSMTEYL